MFTACRANNNREAAEQLHESDEARRCAVNSWDGARRTGLPCLPAGRPLGSSGSESRARCVE